MNKSIVGFSLAVFFCGFSAAWAQPQPPQPAPQPAVQEGEVQQEVTVVHRAEYVDEKGNTVRVTTFSDGTLAVSVNGGRPVRGAQALALLAAHGVSLSVSPSGEIVSQNLAQNTTVKTEPRPVTRAEAAEVAPVLAERAGRAEHVSMPANIATGSGMQNYENYATAQTTTETQNNINGRPVSR